MRKIAEMLSTRTGDHYKSKDVRNVLTKYKAKLDGGNLIVNEPLSPGGQIMREEEKTKRMTKALKFNKAFDVAKVQSEILSQQNQRTFDEHLKASKNFLSLLKHGLPEELMNYLDSPTRYSITEESDLESDNNETATKEVSQSLPNHHEVPAALAVLFGFDCLVREVDPDGGCLFGSLNVHLFGNTNYSEFRMKIHQLVIGWIYFYRNALAYDPPIEITVGVGQEKYCMVWYGTFIMNMSTFSFCNVPQASEVM